MGYSGKAFRGTEEQVAIFSCVYTRWLVSSRVGENHLEWGACVHA